jgi:hypothetical protein
MSFWNKLFGSSSNRDKKDFIALIGTLSSATTAMLCPEVDFEAGTFELNKLPRQLKCTGCGKEFTLPSDAFLVKQGFLASAKVGFLEDANFGFRTNAVGSLTGIAQTHKAKLLILTACGALSIIESMRSGQAATWGCFECQKLDNPFPAGWPGEDSLLGVVKRVLRASAGATDFVGRLQREGFVIEKKEEDGGPIFTVLGRRGFIVLMSVVPRLGADRIIQLSVGEKGDHGFKLIEDGERKFR